MASVTLPDLYIHLESSHATYVTATIDGETEKPEIIGRIGSYAGGRLRAISRPGLKQTFTLQLEMVPRATVDQLRSWTGTELMFRDTRGRVFWGVYFTPAIEELAVVDDVANVTLEVQTVTGTIAV